MAVDLLMDALTDIRIGFLTNNIGVDVLVDANANVSAGVMPGSVEYSCFWAAFDCRSMAALDCASVLQAWIPSYHV